MVVERKSIKALDAIFTVHIKMRVLAFVHLNKCTREYDSESLKVSLVVVHESDFMPKTNWCSLSIEYRNHLVWIIRKSFWSQLQERHFFGGACD